MPIYEYRCQACRHQLETLQGFSDDPLTECPECHQQELKRLISNSAVHFKGSGWYITDYARKDKGGSTTKTEDKPADAKPAESSTTEAA